MSLFSELKRRNVFRIGAAYLIVSWVLMQVTALAAPALRLPEWVTTFVVFILLLGFPVSLVLAWAYEVTPDGVRKTRDVPLEQSMRRLTARKLNFLVTGLLGVAVVVLLVERFSAVTPGPAERSSASRPNPGDVLSIAVLPFVNMSDDREQEHFADGLTEEILNSLAGVRDIDVVSRTSSFAFKDSEMSTPDIARELGVEFVLEGSVRRAGDGVRVTAQLIEAGADAHLWSRTFDRELNVASVLGIQEEVAVAVARALNASLTPAELARRGGGVPRNMVALDHYYDGLYLLRRMELGDFDFGNPSIYYEAVAAFEAAIDADPEWAPSHAALGRVHHFFKDVDPERQLGMSREKLDEAIRLDPEYGPAYASLGYVNMVEGDYDASIVAYETAADLGAADYWGRALLANQLGRFDDAVEHYRRASAHDPLSAPVRAQLVDALYCAGRYRELENVSREFIRAAPENAFSYHRGLYAYALARNGDRDAAASAADDVVAITGSDMAVADTLALLGQDERARNAVNAIDSSAWWRTRAAAAVTLGDTETAIDILEQAAVDASDSIPALRCSPEVRSLAGNPRFDALLERLDLPE